MEPLPDNLKSELQTLGRPKYHRLHRLAAMLHYYRIDGATIVERLVERGCSYDLADWILRRATRDSALAKRLEEADSPETTQVVVLKGLNGIALLVIVGLVAHFIQITDSMALLFVCAPFMLIAAFAGFFMTVRMFVELRRRLGKDRA